MEQPTIYKFPLFANKNANDPDKFIDIAEFIVSAKTGVWKEQVKIVRNALAQSGRDSPPHTKAKGNLPAITLSVNCSTRAKDADVPMAEKYLGHTLLLQGDFDLKASLETCNELKQRLSNDQHLPFVSISPSGDGVKAALLVSVPAEIAAQLADPNKAREIHQGIAKGGNAYFLRTYGLENDKSVKDLFRLFFVLYDPEIYYNLNAIPLELDIDYFREEKPMPKAKTELPSNKANLLPNSNELSELPPNTAKWLGL